MRLIMAAAQSAERDDIESLLADDAIAVSDGGVAQRLGQPLRQ
jgi:RNA polymerase sigma-70 factor (ECF subfamily)